MSTHTDSRIGGHEFYPPAAAVPDDGNDFFYITGMSIYTRSDFHLVMRRH